MEGQISLGRKMLALDVAMWEGLKRQRCMAKLGALRREKQGVRCTGWKKKCVQVETPETQQASNTGAGG